MFENSAVFDSNGRILRKITVFKANVRDTQRYETEKSHNTVLKVIFLLSKWAIL